MGSRADRRWIARYLRRSAARLPWVLGGALLYLLTESGIYAYAMPFLISHPRRWWPGPGPAHLLDVAVLWFASSVVQERIRVLGRPRDWKVWLWPFAYCVLAGLAIVFRWGMPTTWRYPDVVGGVWLAAIKQDLLFRAVLLGGLVELGVRPKLAIAAQALANLLWDMGFPDAMPTLQQFVLSVVSMWSGIILLYAGVVGYAVWRSGVLWPAMVLHALIWLLRDSIEEW